MRTRLAALVSLLVALTGVAPASADIGDNRPPGADPTVWRNYVDGYREEPDWSPRGTIVADSGFRSHPDGFSFFNTGVPDQFNNAMFGTPLSGPKDLDAEAIGAIVEACVAHGIEAPDARLKPGMTAEVSVVTEQLDDVVMVPTMALMTEDGEHYYVNVATDDEGKQTRRVKVTVVTQNDNEAVVGKTQVKRDDQGNEINPNVPVTKLRDGDTLVMDTGADATADGGYGADSGSMSADEGM